MIIIFNYIIIGKKTAATTLRQSAIIIMIIIFSFIIMERGETLMARTTLEPLKILKEIVVAMLVREK